MMVYGRQRKGAAPLHPTAIAEGLAQRALGITIRKGALILQQTA